MSFDPQAARERFHALGYKREEIKKVSDPIRAKRDKFVQDARAKEMKLNAELREAEQGLYELDQERAILARALLGQTGEPV